MSKKTLPKITTSFNKKTHTVTYTIKTVRETVKLNSADEVKKYIKTYLNVH